jgi:hypothetical protein
MQALQVFAGPRARARLRERGLRPEDVLAVPGAAGGPKGLALNPLDRYLFGRWLPAAKEVDRPVHLLGASIGAWRLGCACLADPAAELARMAEGYIGEDYGPEEGTGEVRRPPAREVTRAFAQNLAAQFGGREAEVLAHPRYRLHVFTSHGRRLLTRPGPWQTALGFGGAFCANALNRRALGGWLERVVFGDPRDGPPLPLNDFPSRFAPLTATNLRAAILASCSIPLWLDAVLDIPGGPAGAYWDGGIIDYHLHLPYAEMAGAAEGGLALYPHFQPRLVPGWLDKPWKGRHRATPFLDNLVLLAPDPDWVRTLPGGKLPDRNDFKAYGADIAGRQRAWRRALAECRRLADDFDALAARRDGVDALPLP